MLASLASSSPLADEILERRGLLDRVFNLSLVE
jgi:hypothetical protein